MREAWRMAAIVACLVGVSACGGSSGGGNPPAMSERVCEPPSETVPIAGRRADFPPSQPDARSCVGSEPSSNYVMPADAVPAGAAEELHVVAVYRGARPDGSLDDVDAGENEAALRVDDPLQGVVRVTVMKRPRPVVLSLHASEPVRWEITVEPGASVSRIVTQGYSDHEVVGAPAGAAVIHRGFGEGAGCMYGWEVSENLGCDYWTSIRAIRRFTGLTETSFQGCYTGSEFVIPHWDGEAPSCRESEVTGDETRPRREVQFPGCEPVMAERSYCLTTSEGAIAVLGLDSGTVCPALETTARLGQMATHSITWRGELLYACTDDGLIRISLRDGAWEAVQLPCEAVADADGELLVMRSFRDPLGLEGAISGTIWAYADYAKLLSGAVETTYHLQTTTRMTAHRSRLFGAWHATDTVSVLELPSGDALNPLHLEGYDDWIFGMAVTDGGELVVSGTISARTVVLFDAESGSRLRELALDRPAVGLSCVQGE